MLILVTSITEKEKDWVGTIYWFDLYMWIIPNFYGTSKFWLIDILVSRDIYVNPNLKFCVSHELPLVKLIMNGYTNKASLPYALFSFSSILYWFSKSIEKKKKLISDI